MQTEELCGGMIKQIHDSIEKTVNRSLRSQGLTLAQVKVLMMLDGAPGGTLALKELERMLHVAQSTAAGIVARLEQKGFAEAAGDGRDRRVKTVRITDAGRSCCEGAEGCMLRTERRLLAPLSGEEQTVFLGLLRKICGSL